MTLPSGHLKSKLIKKFTALGPTSVRSNVKTTASFRLPAVCVNVKPAPEKREFWGWWMRWKRRLRASPIAIRFGLFDKEGDWRPVAIDDPEVTEKARKGATRFSPTSRSTIGNV